MSIEWLGDLEARITEAAEELRRLRGENEELRAELIELHAHAGSCVTVAVQERAGKEELAVALLDGVRQTDRKSRLKLAYQLADAQTKFIPTLTLGIPASATMASSTFTWTSPRAAPVGTTWSPASNRASRTSRAIRRPRLATSRRPVPRSRRATLPALARPGDRPAR